MNEYQLEQSDALRQVSDGLNAMSCRQIKDLRATIAPYIAFREKVDGFLDAHFSAHCTRACFENQKSACCSKDGIIAFWADVVVNACLSGNPRIDQLFETIAHPHWDNKCIFLKPGGCVWKIRPLVCAMFLCDQVQDRVFSADPHKAEQWNALGKEAKAYRWPEKPVLFDALEKIFLDLGCDSSLMFLNKSPGLLRIKQQAGLIDKG